METTCSDKQYDEWFGRAYDLVRHWLGKAQANQFKRIVDTHKTRAHRLNGGAGWLNARAEQITEADLAEP
jgi:hypothetical protein